MKRVFFLALVFLFILTGCDDTIGTPLIKVDQQHADLSQFYEISAGSGFLLDISTYQFTNRATGMPLFPNYVEVVMGTGSYGQEWPEGQSQLLVTTSTLQPFEGVERFESFQAGQQFFVAIGEKGSDGLFHSYWMGAVTIK